MAIDTRDKRSSAIHVGIPFRGMLPLPDGGLASKGDRLHVAGFYRGIVSAVVPVDFIDLCSAQLVVPKTASATLVPAEVGTVNIIAPEIGTSSIKPKVC